MARVMVAFANKASMDTARRVARQKLEKATNGLGFSNYRPFGWNEDRLTLNEPEAEILRQAAQDVLSGTGLFVICGRLNRQGIGISGPRLEAQIKDLLFAYLNK